MRKNTRALLSQLSTIGINEYLRKISSQKGVRSDLQPRTERGTVPQARTTVKESEADVDGSANLFFYLFEDYSAGISILKDSSMTLSRLTEEVLQITDRHKKDRDSSYIIKILYARSKDLRQLKHLFESYEKLFKGILDLGTDTGSEDRDLVNNSTANLNGTPARGVKLSQKAFDRFTRLNDRLKLLMLDTIDEYLEEKTSLSNTYFNLLALKDSQTTAKLNRSASLLAKLSVFFLPISFMTSYYSVEIPELSESWTGRTYWVSFAVIATLSFMSLFFFSRLLMIVSDVLDEKLHNMQKGTWRTVKTVASGVAAKNKRRTGDDDSGEKRLDDD
ncbi:ADP-ribosylation factor [Diaporthe helianthi]|uniref:ADP-ribosylation factor n=1 Tax=Diaporthe helianthi TaxID=158607 RepID=A0A2P5IAL6_DIAHE|nr:ADP-ribosylation factor [Diaporthe helianthi]